MRLQPLLAAAISFSLAACHSVPAVRSDRPAANYLAALERPSVINPSVTTTAALQGASASQRLSTFERMLRRAGVQDCKPNASRITERTQDGRSLWNVWCRGGATGVNSDYVFYIPAKTDTFAQILRCRRQADGGSQCSAF